MLPHVLAVARQTDQAVDADQPLRERQRAILRLVADGLSNREIAGQIHLSELTVKSYIEELLNTWARETACTPPFSRPAAGGSEERTRATEGARPDPRRSACSPQRAGQTAIRPPIRPPIGGFDDPTCQPIDCTWRSDPRHDITGAFSMDVNALEARALLAPEWFRIMADAAPVMIWMSGADKLSTYFNRPWLEFTGRPMDQELGIGWSDVLHPDDFQRCLTTYTEAFDARRAFEMECRARRHDGLFRPGC